LGLAQVTTAYEDNLELEKFLEHIHAKIGHARKIVERAKPDSIPKQITHKLDFLEVSLRNLRDLAKVKERW
jgi:hypothetical protein